MTQVMEKSTTSSNHGGNKPPNPVLVEELRAKGYLKIIDAAQYLGLPTANKNGQNTINRWRTQGRLAAKVFDGNWFYHTRDLDTMKELMEMQKQPVTPLPASTWDRYHPDQHLSQSPATPLLDEEEQQESREEEEEELDLVAVYDQVQTHGLRTVRRMGITRLATVKVEPVEATQVPVYMVKVQEQGASRWYTVRVSVENGQYIPYSPDLIPYLEQQIDELTQEVIAQEQLARIYRGKVTHIHVDGFSDPEQKLAVDMEKLDGDRVRLTCTDHDFPFQAIGPNRERAEANLRFLLRACLCNYERDAQTHGLTIPQESQLEILKLLFDEVE